MSARTLYASHHNREIQEALAQKMLTRMLGMRGEGAFGPMVKFLTAPDRAVRSIATYPNPKTGVRIVSGVRMEYEVPLFLIPPLGIIRGEDVKRISRLKLVSETYMDREPSQDECYKYFEKFVDKHFPYLQGVNREAVLREASDNGC